MTHAFMQCACDMIYLLLCCAYEMNKLPAKKRNKRKKKSVMDKV